MAREIQIQSGVIWGDTYDPSGSHNSMNCCKCKIVRIYASNIHNSSVRLSNITFNGLDYSVTLLSVNGTTPSFPITLAPGAIFYFDIEICSLTKIDSYFNLYFTTLEHGIDDVNVIPYDCDAQTCLCCNDGSLATRPGLLRPVDILCGSNDLVTSTICDKKQLTFSFLYDNGLFNGLKIWLDPGLFVNICDASGITSPPAVAWFIEYDNTMTDGSPYAMTLIGAGGNVLNQTNFAAYFIPDAVNNKLNFAFDFFLITDFDSYLSASTFPNDIKFKKNIISAFSNYSNSTPSVYNSIKKLCCLVYIQDPNIIVGGLPLECAETFPIKFSARWYDRGLYNGAPEFVNFGFTFQRAIGSVTNFSTIEQTEVIFKVLIPPTYSGCNGVVFQLFDETQFDNSVDFLTNYDSSRASITNIAIPGILDNHFLSPSALTNLGGNLWEARCYVGTSINSSSTYRVAAIVYGGDLETANTFLSDPIAVTETPDPNCDCNIETTSEFDQVFQSQETKCLQPAPKERIQHRLTLSEGTFKDCLISWNALPPGSVWRDYLKRITLTIYKKVDAFPTPTQTTFFVYSQHVSNRVPGFPFGWQNLNDLIVQDDGTSDVLTSYLTRVRWENTPFTGQVLLAPTAQYMNRTNAGALASTYISTNAVVNSWIEEDVFFEYRFEFDLSAIFGSGYSWNTIEAFKVNAIDFEPDNSGFSSLLESYRVEGLSLTSGIWETIDEGEGQGTFCPDDFEKIRIQYDSTPRINGDFIFFLEPSPYGINNLQESEANISPFGIPLNTIPGVILQDVDYSPGYSAIVFDPSVFSGMTDVRICGYISTPAISNVCEWFPSYVMKVGSGNFAPANGTTQTLQAILTASGIVNLRYKTFEVVNSPTLTPVFGGSYVIEVEIINQNPLISNPHPLEFYFGGNAPSRTPDVVIPANTIGTYTIPFIWGGNGTQNGTTLNFVRMTTGYSSPNTAWSGTIKIKIGNSNCP